ncbi:hypothetical protein [Alkalibacterium sp. 20]|uniref:hypothetical protein n=1 Tax=Alkalibacterium sp. 20 TaxID=1798803 RepID=UPI0009004A3B|nr:hypothetical protein [Alkalibacterium sp. 20]OJF94678.1 hypothetical protein AX762_07290 [Alkalibacterium sp. 20]
MNLLNQYIVALTHLYGAVHKNEIVETYNAQNEKSISVKDVEKQLRNPSAEVEKRFTFAEGNYFISEAVAIFDDLEELIVREKGNPRYYPSKNELLKDGDLIALKKLKNTGISSVV